MKMVPPSEHQINGLTILNFMEVIYGICFPTCTAIDH